MLIWHPLRVAAIQCLFALTSQEAFVPLQPSCNTTHADKPESPKSINQRPYVSKIHFLSRYPVDSQAPGQNALPTIPNAIPDERGSFRGHLQTTIYRPREVILTLATPPRKSILLIQKGVNKSLCEPRTRRRKTVFDLYQTTISSHQIHYRHYR
jgi:hypothetical protein